MLGVVKKALSLVSFMLRVIYSEYCKQGHCAECHNAECRYAEWRYAECLYAICRFAECHGAVSSVWRKF